jgi:hypothetical protein
MGWIFKSARYVQIYSALFHIFRFLALFQYSAYLGYSMLYSSSLVQMYIIS